MVCGGCGSVGDGDHCGSGIGIGGFHLGGVGSGGGVVLVGRGGGWWCAKFVGGVGVSQW